MNYIDFIIPGYSDFVNQVKPEVEQPIRTDFSLFGGSDPDSLPEANTPDGLIPTTYRDGNITRITVFDLDEPIRYTYSPKEGLKQVRSVF